MADLDFKHHVSQIPAGQALPESRRTTSVEISSPPDFQTAINNYASNTNWLSPIGSTIAATASTALASKLGAELGQNPQGPLPTSITEFDKTLSQSYQTQAHATLGLQANKLITDSNLEVAKANRITPEIIARANQQVTLGLSNIFKNAPTEIRPQLEYQYGNQLLNQNEELTKRMLSEQRKDRNNNTAYASQVNSESAYTSAFRGQDDVASEILDTTIRMNQADVDAGIIDPVTAKTRVDSVRQSVLIGKYNRKYDEAQANGKGAQYLRELGEKKPSDIPDSDYQTVLNHVLQHINQNNSLIKQDQALAMIDFKVKVAENPLSITGSDIAELRSRLDPQQYQEANFYYVQAIKKLQTKKNGVNEALSVYTNPAKFSQQTAANKNGAWEATYTSMMNNQSWIDRGITIDQAKLLAAAAAPMAIPAYVEELNTLLATADPKNLEVGLAALTYMNGHNLNQNLSGIGVQQEAMAEVYEKLRQTLPPIEAAQKAHETVYNKSKEQREANTQALKDYYHKQKSKNESPFNLIRRLVDTPSNLKIRNLPGYTQKANRIFETYFDVTNGDEATASKLTKQYINTQYGRSTVNGEPELMYHPIENIPGIPQDAIGAIQSDIVNQANIRFSEETKLYQEGKVNYWWEARQKISADEAKTSKRIVDAINENFTHHPITGALFDVNSKRKEYKNHYAILQKYNNQTITIVKHNRSGKDEVFEGAIQANPLANNTGNPSQPISGGWDFMIKTENGMVNIPLMNPLDSRISYNPRVDYIQSLYHQTVGLSTLETFAANAPEESIVGSMRRKPPKKEEEKLPINPFKLGVSK